MWQWIALLFQIAAVFAAAHIAALRKLGPTPIHRRTFIKNFV